jgi:menaquinone-dependent protoporphyrinogen IX oxidase
MRIYMIGLSIVVIICGLTVIFLWVRNWKDIKIEITCNFQIWLKQMEKQKNEYDNSNRHFYSISQIPISAYSLLLSIQKHNNQHKSNTGNQKCNYDLQRNTSRRVFAGEIVNKPYHSNNNKQMDNNFLESAHSPDSTTREIVLTNDSHKVNKSR